MTEQQAQRVEDCCKAVLKDLKDKDLDTKRTWQKEKLIALKAKEYGVRGKFIEKIILDK